MQYEIIASATCSIEDREVDDFESEAEATQRAKEMCRDLEDYLDDINANSLDFDFRVTIDTNYKVIPIG